MTSTYMENVEILSNFCKEQGIQVTSDAVATVWAAFQTNVALDEDVDEETTLDEY